MSHHRLLALLLADLLGIAWALRALARGVRRRLVRPEQPVDDVPVLRELPADFVLVPAQWGPQHDVIVLPDTAPARLRAVG